MKGFLLFDLQAWCFLIRVLKKVFLAIKQNDCEQATGSSFPPSSVGMHTELCYCLDMHSHAGANEISWLFDKPVLC